MRGFSNKHFVSAGPILPPERPWEGNPQVIFKGHPKDLPNEIAIDFARYAPVRIVSTNETIPGDLGKEQPIAMSWDLAKRSFGQGFTCLWNIQRVLMTRARLRVRLAYHRIMQARFLPWMLAGLGMPGWAMYVLTEMVR